MHMARKLLVTPSGVAGEDTFDDDGTDALDWLALQKWVSTWYSLSPINMVQRTMASMISLLVER